MSTNRLNNDMRDAFIDAVMDDVPKVDYEEKIRDAVNKAAHAELPAAVKKLLASEDTAGLVNIESVTFNRHDNIPDGLYVSFRLPASSDKSLRELALGATEELRKAWSEQHASRNSLIKKIRSVAYHCNTRKQLADGSGKDAVVGRLDRLVGRILTGELNGFAAAQPAHNWDAPL